jgi:hypothetical protein
MFQISEVRRVKGGYKFKWLIREERDHRAGVAVTRQMTATAGVTPSCNGVSRVTARKER